MRLNEHYHCVKYDIYCIVNIQENHNVDIYCIVNIQGNHNVKVFATADGRLALIITQTQDFCFQASQKLASR